MHGFDHKDIEKRWQEQWEKDGLYTTPDKDAERENFYTLVEFPYPSGNLHVGHWYAFAVTDIYARFMRMQGKNVMFPFGFDAFGLPAENAAIKRGLNPRDWTEDNMTHMRGQIRSMGTMFDWSREVVTCRPDYYRWTQWLFLQMFEKGLAYQKETSVNWCPSCKTVLANEQVINGSCERCDSQVEQREMQQWSMKITDYADRLVDDLEELNWPEPIKEAQRQWIGRSQGAEIGFEVKDTEKEIRVFTTTPDTLFGATYMVIAPEHLLVEELLEQTTNKDEVQEYIQKTQRKTELERQENKEKTGVELKGVTAINPANNEEIPIWIADYVLAHFGTGAIMAVPAHDRRDHDFAKAYNLPIVESVVTDTGEGFFYDDVDKSAIQGTLINSGDFTGMSILEAREALTESVGGSLTKQYRLRDWLVSRQRYWGCPIPIIHCEACGAVPVPDDALPVELPDVEDYLPSGEGKSPLAKVESFVNVACPKCAKDAKRETDTLDTFVDSSWYFLRYCDSKNKQEFAGRTQMDSWMPIDFYSGGAEHTTMHLLYSRFFQKVLFDLELVADAEPYKERLNRGLIMGPDGNKMSKSKGNVIDPDDVVERLGADTVRTYLAFIGPYNEVGHYPWDPDGIVGVRRFVERVWRLKEKVSTDADGSSVKAEVHTAIKKVTESLQNRKMNTGVAAMMTLVNVFEKETQVAESDFETLLKLLAPYAPHIAEELWHDRGHTTSIHTQEWPQYDSVALQTDTYTLVVQVNGKVRASLEVVRDISEEEIEKMAYAHESVLKHMEGKEVVKSIHVPQRLFNIVVK